MRHFWIYIIVIVVILILVFLSQQAFSRGIGQSLISKASDQVKGYLSKGSDWVTSNVYPKINEQIQGRGDAIKNEIGQTKEKISENSENILDKAKNYFSGIENSVLHPGENNSCQTQPPQTSSESQPTP